MDQEMMLGKLLVLDMNSTFTSLCLFGTYSNGNVDS